VLTVTTVAILAALLLGGSAASSLHGAVPGEEARVAVHVIARGWHTAIIIPLDAEAIELCPPLADFRGHRYVELGWGNDRFYRAESVTVSLTVRAILWPSASVIHATGLDRPPAESFPTRDLVRLDLDRESHRALLASLRRSFGEREALGPGLVEGSLFYRATESYWFLNTCNVWTLRRLDEAGVETRPVLGIRSDVAMAQVAAHGTPIRLDRPEPKWPYWLAAFAGVALALLRRRARARRDPPPTFDFDLAIAEAAFLFTTGATLLLVVLSAKEVAWAGLGARISVGGIAASLGAVALIAKDRLRTRWRAREIVCDLVAILALGAILGPL